MESGPIPTNRTRYIASEYTDYRYSYYPSKYLVQDGYILVPGPFRTQKEEIIKD